MFICNAVELEFSVQNGGRATKAPPSGCYPKRIRVSPLGLLYSLLQGLNWGSQTKVRFKMRSVGRPPGTWLGTTGVKNMKAWIQPCLNGSGWWWWCNGVGNIFLAHFVPIGTLVPIKHCLNATAYLSIVADMSIPL